ncbi:MAG: hypothetical protein ABIR06_22155 [Cyclobacteriaceae bacterium]
MTIEDFVLSLAQSQPPERLSKLLEALWYDGKKDWEAAHNIAQEIETSEGSLIHAYLHRKEGDSGNASYWYRKAGRAVPDVSLEEEWKQIATELLNAQKSNAKHQANT